VLRPCCSDVEIVLQTCFAHRVEFAVLGRLEVRIDGEAAPLGGPKQRALLALLLLNANEVVSRDRLVDALWGERAPASAQRSLDSYVSRLRTLLGADRIERRPPGYLIQVAPGELDLERFEGLLEDGRAAAAAGDATTASERLREALSLWRGSALGDLLNEPFAGSEAERLGERRLLALEARIDADLALGDGPDLVPELEGLVADNPFRERLLGQLMLALYRAGRQADALAAYQGFRQRLAEELGLEPGPHLRELEQSILQQDARLLGRGTSPRVSARPRRRWVVPVALTLAAVGASAAVGIVLGTRGTSASVVGGTASKLVELSGRSRIPVAGVRLTRPPAALISANGSLWTANPDAGTVSRVDLATTSVDDEITDVGTPAALAAGAGAIWATGVPGEKVMRIDPGTGTVTQTVRLGGVRAAALAFADGGLWVADLTDNSLFEIDPGSGSVRSTSITLPLQPTALAIAGDKAWVADYNGNRLVEVDLRSGERLPSVEVGLGPSAVAVGAHGVWVANALDNTVSRVDPGSGSVSRTYHVGHGPSAIEVADGSVWVANRYSGTVSRIDPNRNHVVATIHVGGEPVALAATGTKIWVASASRGRHRGGTLRLLHTLPITIDPELQMDLLPAQSDALTADGLVTYNHAAGAAGIQLVPDLALKRPAKTDGDTTYTFQLRRDIPYSDGRLVRATDFRRSLERLFSIRHPRSPERFYFDDIVGADACEKPTVHRCDLSRGVVADDSSGTLVIHLRKRDPNFLSDLASRPVPPVPPGTSFQQIGFTPIPGTGPYEIASASKHQIRYVRNPFFREWSHAAQPAGNPDRIITRFGLSHAAEVRAIEKGRADWSGDGMPTKVLSAVKKRFPGQLHRFSIPTAAFFQLNPRIPPFDDIRVRRALNFAINRRVVVRLLGGPDQATPTCQILPPGVAGYRRNCPYTRNPGPAGRWTAPDLAQARRLVDASGTRGTRIRVWGPNDSQWPGVVRYVARVLRRLGYRADVRIRPPAFFDRHPGIFKRVQLKPVGWGDTPYGYFATWFSCGPLDQGWFCDRRVAPENRRAESLAETNLGAAQRVWAGLDHELVARAAWLPLADLSGFDFVSARVRNYEVNRYWDILADQLWLR
jgi:YVTN family beta-propeller protein